MDRPCFFYNPLYAEPLIAQSLAAVCVRIDRRSVPGKERRTISERGT
jgi:hypothetical protein